LIVSWLAGCATPVPGPIRQPVPGAPGVGEVRARPQAYTGRRVRWGGTIATVDNRKQGTWVEVVSRPLDRDGRPKETDATSGRFMARVPGFLDPAVYAAGRAFTVNGVIEGVVRKDIGQYPYRFPVVRADHYHLWAPLPKAGETPYWGPPWWYDPWYPYPWHGPPYWP